MSSHTITKALASLALCVTLAACGGAASSYVQESLDEASGIKVTAQNAGSDMEAVSEGGITVEEGDVIVISPMTERGAFHLTISTQDGSKVIYDDDAQGSVLYTIDAEPGVYDVTTRGKDVTGWMTVFAENEDEKAQIESDLQDKLEQEGVELEDEDLEADLAVK